VYAEQRQKSMNEGLELVVAELEQESAVGSSFSG